jgi:glutaconate CoA-transferase subunit B
VVDTQEYTLEDLLICRMARDMKGEMVAGAATSCSNVAVKLAQALYNPDLIDFSSGLHHFDSRTPATMISSEIAGRGKGKARVSWDELFSLIFRQQFIIWVGPAQVDQNGNANISVVGPWENPKIAMVGARGLPDDSVHVTAMNYHVTDHSKRTFVAHVDFVCAVGFGDARKQAGVKDGEPGIIVSNLGIFDFDRASGQMRIQSLHPGVTLDEVKQNTGFELIIPSEIPRTEPPTKQELDLIPTLDPLGLRFLDRMPRATAGPYMAQALQKENEMFAR